MLLIFLGLLSFCKPIEFEIIGLSTSLSTIYSDWNYYDYNSCPKVICDVLVNTTSAYVIVSPLKKMTSCPNININFNVNMISFIFNQKGQMLFPNSCNNIADCMMSSCNSLITTKDSLGMAFTGQCLS
jgi:hypothetical protein